MSRQPYAVGRVSAFHVSTGIIVRALLMSLGWATQVNAMSGQAPQATPNEDGQSPSLPATTNALVYEEFRGHHRGRAKTDYVMSGDALAPTEKFSDLHALLEFLKPQADSIMRQRYPSLSKADTDAGRRVAEERHNVSVVAFIYAVKHETGKSGDNDFHVILGSAPTPLASTYMTAEASGLPRKGPRRDLIANSREQLLSIIGECRCNGRFRRMASPIRVRVTGSLFFDGEHATGVEGPKYAKTATAWEIHPILTIERVSD